jgi:hypothetical protein
LEDALYLYEVFLGVDADGVEGGGLDIKGDVVFEEAELFEALGMFEGALGQGGEAMERGFAVGVEAEVLPVLRGVAVAVVGDGGAGKIESAAISGGYNFDGVGVVDVFRRADDFEGGDFDLGMDEEL